MSVSLPPEILTLSAAEKLELVGLIWNSIEPHEIELSEGHRRLLDERLKLYEANPTEGRTWEEVKTDLFGKQ